DERTLGAHGGSYPSQNRYHVPRDVLDLIGRHGLVEHTAEVLSAALADLGEKKVRWIARREVALVHFVAGLELLAQLLIDLEPDKELDPLRDSHPPLHSAMTIQVLPAAVYL